MRIESGAKSALDPNGPAHIRPYIVDDAANLDLRIPDVTTIEASRTFWEKMVIAHGLRRWYERHNVLRQEGQRISRHYYDLHCLLETNVGRAALSNPEPAADCVLHAQMFFDRPDYDLASAKPGSFAIAPIGGMIDALSRDYDNTTAMIFGAPPTFDQLLASAQALDVAVNKHHVTGDPSPYTEANHCGRSKQEQSVLGLRRIDCCCTPRFNQSRTIA